MTPQEIREAIQGIVSPHNASPALSASLLNNLADESMNEMVIAAKPPSLRVTVRQDLIADQAEYPMAANMLLPLALRFSTHNRWETLKKVTQEQLADIEPDWNSETNDARGTTQYYYESGIVTTVGADYGKRNISLWPIPTVTVDDGLESTYLRRPTKMVDVGASEVIDVDAAHHFGIVYRVAYKLLLRQGSKLTKGVLDAYDTLWKQAVFNLKAHHSEAWLDDMKIGIGTFRGVGVPLPWAR